MGTWTSPWRAVHTALFQLSARTATFSRFHSLVKFCCPMAYISTKLGLFLYWDIGYTPACPGPQSSAPSSTGIFLVGLGSCFSLSPHNSCHTHTHTNHFRLVLLKVCILTPSLANPHLVLFHTCISPTPWSRTKMCFKAACETIRNLNHRLFKCILISRKLHFPPAHHTLAPKLIPSLLALDCVVKEGPIPFPCLSFFN